MQKRFALNFGCGKDIKKEDGEFIWDNVDMQYSNKLTAIFDFDKLPYDNLEDNKYDFILMSHVLGHLIYPDRVLYELWKKCRHKAIIRIVIGHYGNKGSYQDLRHKTYFCEETFLHFAQTKEYIQKHSKFKIKRLYSNPTIIGKFFPKRLRKILSLFIGGLISTIVCEYEVNKMQEQKDYLWE